MKHSSSLISEDNHPYIRCIKSSSIKLVGARGISPPLFLTTASMLYETVHHTRPEKSKVNSFTISTRRQILILTSPFSNK